MRIRLCHAQIPHSDTTPTYVCNSEKVARHSEQTRTEIAAGTYRHREQQQQQQQRYVGRTPIDVAYTRTKLRAAGNYRVSPW